MRGPIRSVLLAALAVCVFAVAAVGSASAATMQAGTTALVAIYGNPGSNGALIPVGGGLARNFGTGANMLYQAGNGLGELLSITLKNEAKTKDEAALTEIGGTLMANKTGENNPLDVAVQFVDFQKGTLAGFADTFDRPWIMYICPQELKTCRLDPRFTVAGLGAPEPTVRIEDVSINLGPGIMIQGTVWGKWTNGAAKKPPCITLQNKPANAAADQNLFVTQTSNAAAIPVGTEVETVKGMACLSSMNNYWYTVAPAEEPAITIENN